MYIIFPSSLSPRGCGVYEKPTLFSVEEVEGCFFFLYYCCCGCASHICHPHQQSNPPPPHAILHNDLYFPYSRSCIFFSPNIVSCAEQVPTFEQQNNFDINIDKINDIHTPMMPTPLLIFLWGLEICVWWCFVWGYMDFKGNEDIMLLLLLFVVFCLMGWTIENCWWIRTTWGDIQTPACCVVH